MVVIKKIQPNFEVIILNIIFINLMTRWELGTFVI